MLVIDFVLAGERTRLPNDRFLHSHPMLCLMEKGIQEIFGKVSASFPGEDILIIWDEDNRKLFYSSDTLSHSQISEEIKKLHGVAI